MRNKLLLLLVFFSLSAHAQDINWYVGYKTGYTQMTNLNNLIGRYNETRSFLDKEMHSIHFLDGPSFGCRFDLDIIQMGMGWTGRNAIRKAGGIDISGLYAERNFKVRYNTIDMFFNFMLTESAGFGFSFDLGNAKSFTRTVYENDDKKEIKYEELDHELMVGSSFYLIYRPDNGFLEFTLFAHLPYNKFNFQSSGYSLDAMNYNRFSWEDFESRPTMVGFGIYLIL